VKGISQLSHRQVKYSLLDAAILTAILVFPWPSALGSFTPKLDARHSARRNGTQEPIRVRSILVQVDALVTDANGNRVENLNFNNFQLSEDRRPQKITAVDFYNVSNAQASQDSRPIDISLTDSTDSEIRDAVGRDHRLIVLFFDLSSFHPFAKGTDNSTLTLSVTSAKKFVNEQMTPADLATVVAFSTELSVAADFTNEHATLNKALDSLLPDTLNTCNNGSTSCSLLAAEALSKMLARFPGRKSVIHFTGGIPVKDTTRIDMEKATDAANKSDVSFYEIDGKGLQTVCGDASVGSGRVTTKGGCLNTPRFNGSRTVQDTLAHDTGGALFVDLKDFRPFFKQILDESTGYYLLSYESSNQKHDGLYRSIAIKLAGVPDSKIKCRPGYFAPRD
jgi:VWFA-related protein